MKYLFSCLTLLLFSVAVSAQVNLTQGLIAHYPFNGNSNDQSGNGNHPYWNNATLVAGKKGVPNSAYYFNGINSYIEIPSSASLNPSQVTLFALVKPQGFYTGNCHANVILSRGTDKSANSWYSLLFSDVLYTNNQNCGNVPVDSLHQNFYGTFGTNGAVTSAYTPYVEKEKWYYVTLTYDGAITKFYVNGNLIASKVGSSPVSNNGSALFLGTMNDPLFPYWFKGVMDEVRIYNRALNADEVSALSQDCNSFNVTGGVQTISVTGLAGAPIAGIQVFNSNWQSVFSQVYNSPQDNVDISLLPAGQYFVNVRYYGSDWSIKCERGFNAVVTAPSEPSFVISNVTVNESAGTASLQICLTAQRSSPSSVNYATRNGTATVGNDYLSKGGTITIPAGQLCASVEIDLVNDQTNEQEESFFVVLGGSAIPISIDSGVVTITDDDQTTYNCNGIEITPAIRAINISGLNGPIVTIQVFNSAWATVFNQTYTNPPNNIKVEQLSGGLYNVKVTYYTSGWQFICEKSLGVVVVDQCPQGSICVSNSCPSTTVNLNNVYSVSGLPSGTTVTWHTGTPATDNNKMSPASVQNVSVSGTYYAAINISGVGCYSSTIPVVVTISSCGSAQLAKVSGPAILSEEFKRSVTIAPNPFKSSIRINIDSKKKEKATLVFSDAFGKLLATKQVELTEGINRLTMDDLGKFPAGSYFLRIVSSNSVESYKVLRQQ